MPTTGSYRFSCIIRDPPRRVPPGATKNAVGLATELAEDITERIQGLHPLKWVQKASRLILLLVDVGFSYEAATLARTTQDPLTKLQQQLGKACAPEVITMSQVLSICYFKSNQSSEASDALDMVVALGGEYSKSLDASPDLVASAVGQSFHNHALYLHSFGKTKEATKPLKLAVEIRTTLASKDPSLNSDLISSCDKLSEFFSKIRQFSNAVTYMQKIVDTRSSTASADQGSENSDLAEAYSRLASYFSELEQYEDAVDAMNKAVEMRRILAKNDPESYSPSLASSCHELANFFGKLNRYKDAIDYANQAVEIRIGLVGKDPEHGNIVLSASYHDLGYYYARSKKYRDAVGASRKAVELREELATKNPDFDDELATSYHSLAMYKFQLKKYGEAVNYMREAAELRTILANKKPEVYGGLLASSCKSMSWYLREIGKGEEAEAWARKEKKVNDAIKAGSPIPNYQKDPAGLVIGYVDDYDKSASPLILPDGSREVKVKPLSVAEVKLKNNGRDAIFVEVFNEDFTRQYMIDREFGKYILLLAANDMVKRNFKIGEQFKFVLRRNGNRVNDS